MKLLSLLTVSLLCAVTSYSQNKNVSFGTTPNWVTEKQIDFTNTSLDKEAQDGYINLYYAEEINIATQSEYNRSVKKILSEAGVQNASQVSISFDPSYQKLTIHSINIVRNGLVLNKLERSKIKVIQQEKDLKDFIYDGSLNAIEILEDVRAGDIIDFSYTVQGFNPIFKGKYSAVLSMGFSQPLYALHYKVISTDNKLTYKSSGENISPVITTKQNQTVYEWSKTDLHAIESQDYIPSWYNLFPVIMLSEYQSWKEVNDWALTLFPPANGLSKELQSAIKDIDDNNQTSDKKIGAALRLVQDDIRYMGFEMGENSHKPRDPSKVFAQRFGDCKEKSYLLCTILNQMQIVAHPVLINTSYKNEVGTWLPASTNFDHCVVQVIDNNKTYWFDPTIAYQRGPLSNIYFPNYKAGLVLTDTTTAISNIPFNNINSVEVKNVFSVKEMYGSGKLKVTTVNRGTFADEARQDFKNSSVKELLDTYKKFYASSYEDIVADSLNFKDDENTGIFTTTEYYTLPTFWETNKAQVKKFSTSALVIESVLKRPKDKKRTMPFYLNYPADYKEFTQIILPEDWTVHEDEQHLKNKCFEFNSKFYCRYNSVYLESSYRNLKDFVDTKESASYFRDLKAYDDNSEIELTNGLDVVTPNNTTTSSTNLLLSILLVGGVVVGFIVWSQRK